MTAARSLKLTHGEVSRLPPEAEKQYYRALLQSWGVADAAKLQAEHQKDFTEDQDDQYLGGARED